MLAGLGVETSAVCAGRVNTMHHDAQLRLSGCEVASAKSPIAEVQYERESDPQCAVISSPLTVRGSAN